MIQNNDGSLGRRIKDLPRVCDDPENVITEDDLKILDGKHYVSQIDDDEGDEESISSKLKEAYDMHSGQY